MRFEVDSGAPLGFETGCLVLPVWQGGELDGVAAKLNEELNGLIKSLFDEDGFKGTVGDTRTLYTSGHAGASRTILVGLGKRDKYSTANLRKAAAKAARAVRKIKRDNFAFVLPAGTSLDTEQAATAVTEGITLALYSFTEFKTDEETMGQTEIKQVTILALDGELASDEGAMRGLAYGRIAAEANLRARHWVNLPSNCKSPQFLALQAQQIAREYGMKCEVWDEDRIREERMGALYAVGMGSDNPPRLIVIDYAPAGQEESSPIVLVGKGMTFDSGGLSIKPAQSMEDMKDDMAGAAVVMASMSAIAQVKLPRRVVGIVASAENMINGRAQRPGDIVTARNGKTVEVLNTDAEARLILADALTLASELKPAAIIDFATLTGAIGIALGQEGAGLFANDDELSAKIKEAGDRTGERVWPFPMWDEYKDYVKGTSSDLKNIGPERRAGSIVGAVFLENFVSDGIPWAHLDIAAVSLLREERPLSARGATGFGVRLVLDLIQNW